MPHLHTRDSNSVDTCVPSQCILLYFKLEGVSDIIWHIYCDLYTSMTFKSLPHEKRLTDDTEGPQPLHQLPQTCHFFQKVPKTKYHSHLRGDIGDNESLIYHPNVSPSWVLCSYRLISAVQGMMQEYSNLTCHAQPALSILRSGEIKKDLFSISPCILPRRNSLPRPTFEPEWPLRKVLISHNDILFMGATVYSLLITRCFWLCEVAYLHFWHNYEQHQGHEHHLKTKQSHIPRVSAYTLAAN